MKLKKPFAVKPWNGSDENIANLLMVSCAIVYCKSSCEYQSKVC